ncbi:MAG: 2-phosphoglycerate kinase [Actinobacteria bacterium]|nr:2-phosphoglycerate kinase [Actinomycetota bacterium]MBL7123678.1 2-phosphoglycerate kinase [Actinomycetota bacterium]
MDLRNKDEASPRVIVISDKKGGLPFSKGILASSISVTGLDIITAHKIALEIQDYFLKNKIYSLSLGELRLLAFRFIKDKVNLEYAERYLLWQSVGKLEKPIIILIGGSTGVGKSTIATILANRLNITRVASTDAIREVMRASVSEKLIRPLRGSSYNAYKNLTLPPSGVEPVILGFREQVLAVNVGIEAIIKRNIEEKSDIVIEGAHVVPGYLDLREYSSRAIVQQIVISVPDKNIHKEHFTKRTVETQGSRPMDKYIKHLDKIMMIQDYIEKLAKEKNVRIIENYNLDNVVNGILELIFQRVKSEFSKVGSEYTKVN